MCPRSHKAVSRSALWTVIRRGWNSVKRARGGLPGSVPGQSSTTFSGAAVASQKTVAAKSVAKVVEHSEPVSVAGKAGQVITSSQKTEVSSREARVARF